MEFNLINDGRKISSSSCHPRQKISFNKQTKMPTLKTGLRYGCYAIIKLQDSRISKILFKKIPNAPFLNYQVAFCLILERLWTHFRPQFDLCLSRDHIPSRDFLKFSWKNLNEHSVSWQIIMAMINIWWH